MANGEKVYDTELVLLGAAAGEEGGVRGGQGRGVSRGRGEGGRLG